MWILPLVIASAASQPTPTPEPLELVAFTESSPRRNPQSLRRYRHIAALVGHDDPALARWRRHRTFRNALTVVGIVTLVLPFIGVPALLAALVVELGLVPQRKRVRRDAVLKRLRQAQQRLSAAP